MGWGGIQNGKLLALAAGSSFDVFKTVDRNLEHQQNLSTRKFGLVVVVVPDNNIKHFRPIFPLLLQAIQKIKPGQVLHVRSDH